MTKKKKEGRRKKEEEKGIVGAVKSKLFTVVTDFRVLIKHSVSCGIYKMNICLIQTMMKLLA